MPFRRRRGRSGGRKFKTPTIWQRDDVTLTTAAAGALAAVELFDTDLMYSDTAGRADIRWTLRRLILWCEYTVTTSFTAGQNYIIYTGIYVDNDDAPARDPNILVATDSKTDWMYLGTMSLADGATRPDQVGNERIHPIDLRTMRKVDSLSSPSFSMKVVRIDTGAAPAAGVLVMRGVISSLWSATRR